MASVMSFVVRLLLLPGVIVRLCSVIVASS